MSPSDWLSHGEWLIVGLATVVVLLLGVIFWGWNDNRDALQKRESCIRADFKEADDSLRKDIDGIREQAAVFNAKIFSRTDAGDLEERLSAQNNRLEGKVDSIHTRIDELLLSLIPKSHP